MSFGFEKLGKQIEIKNSRLILGLDPKSEMKELTQLMKCVELAEPYIVGVKPNLAYYNEELLIALMTALCRDYPHLVRILDAKRGDINSSQQRYANGDKEKFNPDIATLSVYAGAQDAILPYIKNNIDVFALVADSNPNSMVIQNVKLNNGLRLYQHVARRIHEVSTDHAGYVIGATMENAIRNIRADEGSPAWVLAPGFGAQNANTSFIKHAGPKTVYPMSRGLTQSKYMNGMTTAEAAKHWRDIINDASR